MDAGADPAEKNIVGWSALSVADELGLRDFVTMALARNNDETDRYRAALKAARPSRMPVVPPPTGVIHHDLSVPLDQGMEGKEALPLPPPSSRAGKTHGCFK
jgi:hypothetical protein